MKERILKFNICPLIALLLLTACWHGSAQAAVGTDVKKGNRFYQKGMYGAAVQAYEKGIEQQPNDAIISFNLGTAHYKKQDYNESLNYFYQSLLGDEPSLRQKAYYNLGNTLYRLGEEQADTQLPEAVTLLESAMEEYDKALAIDSQDEDVTFNRAFVEKKYEEYKKALERQQKEQEKGQQNQEGDEQRKDPNKTCPLNNNGSQNKKQDEKTENKMNQPGQEEKDKSRQGKDGEPAGQEDEQAEDARGKGEKDSVAQEKSKGEKKDAATEDRANMLFDEDASDRLDKKEAMMLLDQYMQQQQQQIIFIPPEEYLKMRKVERDW
ncbi:MAG: tetratricopeptide repeat protein [Candidatus Omnitrophica bacterium]|nr:tetratricopeptide repeat protein [Candidatus Omnitrophota bacterium]